MSIAVARRARILVALLLVPSIARAHTSLRASDPAKDARLAVAPTRITLWFTARPQLAFSKLTLTGPSGIVALGPLAADTGDALLAPIVGALAPGEYTVTWQTAAADGHETRGTFTFVYGAATTRPGAPADTSAAAAHQHATPPESAHEGHEEYRSARWIEFVALLTILGVLGFRHGVLPPLAARGVPVMDAGDRARRLGLSAIVLYAAAVLLRAYNESVAVHGVADALVPDQIVPMLTTTIWGTGWLFGAVGAALVAAGWSLARRRVVLGTPLALTGALGLVLSPALSGHAAASRHFVISVVLDVVHVTAAGLWIGGLLMVLFAGIPAMRSIGSGDRDAAVSALVNSFHPLALFCAPLVIAAGVATAYLRLNAFSDLWLTPYGSMLFRKVVFVAVVLGLGMYNSTRMRRSLGDASATRRFRVSGAFELLFAAVVLGATVWLVTMPVPAEMLGG